MDLLGPATSATAAAWSAATAATPATPTPTTLSMTALTRSATADRDRNAIGAVEVHLLAAFLIATFGLVEVVAAFNGDGAGVRRWLALFIARGTWLTLRDFPPPAAVDGCRDVGDRSALRPGSGCPASARCSVEQCLARQLDAVAFDAEDLDQNLVAFTELVLYVLHAVLGDLADVQQSVGAGEDLDEGAELGEANNLAEIGLADFGNGGEVVDHRESLLQALFVR